MFFYNLIFYLNKFVLTNYVIFVLMLAYYFFFYFYDFMLHYFCVKIWVYFDEQFK